MPANLDLSVVLPTYNEAQTLPRVLERLRAALTGVPHEVIVADDDSPDRTWELAERLAAGYPELRCLRRTARRGLYPAVMDGFGAARGRYLALMDADLQHDELLLPRMLEKARREGLALVLGSRFLEGGGTPGLGPARRRLSRAANALAGLVLRRPISDPMTGFFLVERSAFEAVRPRLRPKGFKILMDLLYHLPPGARVGELPFVFAERGGGESKLSGRVTLQFALALAELTVRRIFGR